MAQQHVEVATRCQHYDANDFSDELGFDIVYPFTVYRLKHILWRRFELYECFLYSSGTVIMTQSGVKSRRAAFIASSTEKSSSVRGTRSNIW